MKDNLYASKIDAKRSQAADAPQFRQICLFQGFHHQPAGNDPPNLIVREAGSLDGQAYTDIDGVSGLLSHGFGCLLSYPRPVAGVLQTTAVAGLKAWLAAEPRPLRKDLRLLQIGAIVASPCLAGGKSGHSGFLLVW